MNRIFCYNKKLYNFIYSISLRGFYLLQISTYNTLFCIKILNEEWTRLALQMGLFSEGHSD